MKVASISNFRANISKYVRDVDQDQDPLIVNGSDDVSVVVLPLDMYNSYVETDYLLRNPANAARLRDSIAQLRAGKGEVHELIEP